MRVHRINRHYKNRTTQLSELWISNEPGINQPKKILIPARTKNKSDLLGEATWLSWSILVNNPSMYQSQHHISATWKCFHPSSLTLRSRAEESHLNGAVFFSWGEKFSQPLPKMVILICTTHATSEIKKAWWFSSKSRNPKIGPMSGTEPLSGL